MRMKSTWTFLLTYLKKIYRSLYFAPVIVFVAILVITYLVLKANRLTLKRDIDTAIHDRTTVIQNQIIQHLNSYEQILTGGAGLVRGSQSVQQSEWHEYVSTF